MVGMWESGRVEGGTVGMLERGTVEKWKSGKLEEWRGGKVEWFKDCGRLAECDGRV